MAMSRLEKLMVNSDRRQRSRQAQARRLLARIAVRGADTYLEIGCGTGAVTRCAAADFGLIATGVDLDLDQVRLARAATAADNVRYVAADAARLPFEEESFDIVLSFMATHHIQSLDRALQEIRRVLKPRGHLVYADVFLPTIISAASRLLGHGYHLPRSEAMRAALEREGFAEIHASRGRKPFYGPFEAVYSLGANRAKSHAVGQDRN